MGTIKLQQLNHKMAYVDQIIHKHGITSKMTSLTSFATVLVYIEWLKGNIEMKTAACNVFACTSTLIALKQYIRVYH